MPALPSADTLAAALTTAGMTSVIVEDVRSATEAVDRVLAAAVLLVQPEDTDAPVGAASIAGEEALWEQVERSTDLLAAYARALTDHLPAIRAVSRQRVRQ